MLNGLAPKNGPDLLAAAAAAAAAAAGGQKEFILAIRCWCWINCAM